MRELAASVTGGAVATAFGTSVSANVDALFRGESAFSAPCHFDAKNRKLGIDHELDGGAGSRAERLLEKLRSGADFGIPADDERMTAHPGGETPQCQTRRALPRSARRRDEDAALHAEDPLGRVQKLFGSIQFLPPFEAVDRADRGRDEERSVGGDPEIRPGAEFFEQSLRPGTGTPVEFVVDAELAPFGVEVRGGGKGAFAPEERFDVTGDRCAERGRDGAPGHAGGQFTHRTPPSASVRA